MGKTRMGAAVLLAAVLTGGLVTAAAPPAAAAAPGIITTLAGGPGRGTTSNTSLFPNGVAIGQDGAVYVADQNGVVRRFTGTSANETATAGNAATTLIPGYGGLATHAALSSVWGLTIDHAGNQVIADNGRSTVVVVAAASRTFYGRAMKAGHIYAIAGREGLRGYSGDGGPAIKAELNSPDGTAVDTAGNVLIADTGNSRIRMVAVASGTFYGRAVTAGDIYTIAGGGSSTGNGVPATSAALSMPGEVSVDHAGNVLIADSGHSLVRVVAEGTGTFYGQPMTAGDIYTIAGGGTPGFSGDGGPATAAELSGPSGVAHDAVGNVLIADQGNNRIRVVAEGTGTFYGQPMTAGDIYTVAGNGRRLFRGDGGPATAASMNGPEQVAADPAGNLVIADRDNLRIRVVAAASGTFYRQAMTAGDIYTVAGNGLAQSSGSGAPAQNAEMFQPTGVAVTGSGNYVMTGGNRVWVTAASSGTFFGRAMTAGDIYAVAGNGRDGYSGDGGPGPKARLNVPSGVAVDQAGNVLIADFPHIRVVPGKSGTFYGQAMTAGDIYTIASAGMNGGLAVDAAGNILFCSGDVVQVYAVQTGTFYGQAMTAGQTYTIAGTGTAGFSGDGGPATSAELFIPTGITVDHAGNVVVYDTVNRRDRVIAATAGTFYGQAMTAGDIYTVVGGGTATGDGVPATSASDGGNPAVDAHGNLVLAYGTGTHGGSSVRVVAVSTGTFYGQAMTAGDIYTIAGGRLGVLGDGGPATAASVSPSAVAVDPAGNVVISDFGNARIRLVGE